MEIKLCGVGGQGMGVAGRLIGEAAMLVGWHAVETTAYGVESRGGTSNADVIVSPDPILFPEVRRPDVLLLMAEKGLALNLRGVHNQTLILYDTGTVTREIISPGEKIALPFLATALKELQDREAATMIALGALVGKMRIVPFETLEEALRKSMPAKTQELNLDALRLGRRMIVVT